MSKKLKFIIGIMAIGMLIPIGVSLFLNISDSKKIITSLIEVNTGRQASIKGDLGMSFGFSPTVYAENISLSNSSWGQSPQMLEIDRLSITFSMAGLFSGEILVEEISAQNPKLWIERHPLTGKYNLQLNGKNKKSDSKSILTEYLNIEEVLFDEGEVVYYHDHRNWRFEIQEFVANAATIEAPIEFQLSGEFENTPITLGGETGSLKSILARTEIPLEIRGYLTKQENHIDISGVIGDLIGWTGVNLWGETFTADLSELSSIAGVNLPPFEDVSTAWELVQPGSASTLRMESINIQSSAHGLETKVQGQIGQLTNFNQVDILFSSEGYLDRMLISEHLADDLLLDTQVSGSIKGGKDDLVLTIENGNIHSPGLNFDIEGSVKDMLHNWQSPLEVKAQIDDLSQLGEALNLELPSISDISASGNIYKFDSDLNLLDILITSEFSESSEINILGSGYIEKIGGEQKGGVDFNVVGNTKFINQFVESEINIPLTMISANGTASVDGVAVSIADLSIKGEGEGIDIFGLGRIDPNGEPDIVDINMQARIEGLDKLSDVVEFTLPRTEPVVATANLRVNKQGHYVLDDVNMYLDDPSMTFDLSGSVTNLGGSTNEEPIIDMAFEYNLNNLDRIFEVNPDFPMSHTFANLLPIRGAGEIRNITSETGENHNALINFNARSDPSSSIQGSVSGKIDYLFTDRLDGLFNVSVSGDLQDDMLDLDTPDEIQTSGFMGQLDGSMDILYRKNGVGLKNIDFRVLGEGNKLHAVGNIEQLVPFESSGLDLEVDMARLGNILRLTDSDLNLDNPVKGKLLFDNESKSLFLDLIVAGSDVSGDVYFLSSQGIEGGAEDEGRDSAIKIRGDLKSSILDITALFKKPEESARLFDDAQLDIPWLEKFDIKLDTNIERFKSKLLTLDNVDLTTEVKDGKLIASMIGNSEKGAVTASFELSKDLGQNYISKIDINGSGVALSALTSIADIDQSAEGELSLDIQLFGVGNSISDIMGNSDGAFLMELGGAVVKSQGLQLVSGDLFLGLLTAINPLAKTQDTLDVQCSVINFKIDNGIASTKNGIALKTRNFTVLGGGEIDLSDEDMTLVISTKARKGLGINTNTLAKLIRVGGKISSPEIETNPSGLLQTGVVIGAALASGGMSLIAQGLFDRTKANSDVCGAASELEVEEPPEETLNETEK